MSGSAKSTEAKTTTENSDQDQVRVNTTLRTDHGNQKVAQPQHTKQLTSRARVDSHYRPPQEETRKFHLAALLWLSVISLLLVPMATLLDIPIARWCHADLLPQEFGKMLDLSLIYAHGSGIFLILVAILMMAPTKRWKMPRLATLALGSGAVATLVKMFVLRPRPNSLRLDLATNEHAWIWSFDWTLSRVAEYDAGMRAFPSGYLATATALTVGLWIVVPRGRPLFLAFCIGTMLQRLYCGSHFLSDLFGSAAVGLGWCYICYHPKLIGSIFDKMEAVQHPKRRSANADDNLPALNTPREDIRTIRTSRSSSTPPAHHLTAGPLSPAPLASVATPLSMPSIQAAQTQHETSQHARTTPTTAPPAGYPYPSRQNADDASKDSPSDGGEPKAA